MNPLRPFLPAGRSARTVRSGLFAGIRLELDLRAEAQIWLGLYERETYPAIRRLLGGCRGALDLGAAKGDLTIHLLQQPGMERVRSVEPLERERVQFAANLALNHLDHDPRLSLHAGFAGQGEGPQWRTLDDLCADLPSPLFLKVDVDGPEAGILAAGCATLRAKDCRLLVETHSPEAEAACVALLQSEGYATRIIHPAWWRVVLPEQRPLPHNRWLAAARTVQP